MISPHFRYSPDFILPKSQARLLRAGIFAITREFSKQLKWNAGTLAGRRTRQRSNFISPLLRTGF
jgi:hypothetical protein